MSSPIGARSGRTAGSRRTPPSTREIRARFLPLHEAAAAGALSSWEDTAEGAFALLLVLDQFPRNMFRGDARAFATDPLARAVAGRAIARGFDAAFANPERRFFYLPFMHSEALSDQEHCADLCRAAADPEGVSIRPASRRHHPPLRPVSAPQCCARTHDDAAGAGVPRRRRFFRLTRNHEGWSACLRTPPLKRGGLGDRGPQARCLRRVSGLHPNPPPEEGGGGTRQQMRTRSKSLQLFGIML